MPTGISGQSGTQGHCSPAGLPEDDTAAHQHDPAVDIARIGGEPGFEARDHAFGHLLLLGRAQRGVGGREIGYMFGQYKRITNQITGVLTGKGGNTEAR